MNTTEQTTENGCTVEITTTIYDIDFDDGRKYTAVIKKGGGSFIFWRDISECKHIDDDLTIDGDGLTIEDIIKFLQDKKNP